MNAYELLESKLDDDIEVIKLNYHRLILKYHPDKIKEKNEETMDLFIKFI